MPDTPDYSRYLPGSTRYALNDLGELASRLGSIDKYDRRGEVLWMDDMGHGVATYTRGYSGTNGAVVVSADYTLHGGYCLRLISGSTGLQYAYISRSFGLATRGKTGVELAVYFEGKHDHLYLQLTRLDGSHEHRSYLRVSAVTGLLQITDASNNLVTIGILGKMWDPLGIYYLIKMVSDFEHDKYVRLMVDEYEYDLGGYGLYVFPAAEIPQYRVDVIQVGRSGYNDVAVLGHIIITGNEI